MIKRSLPWLFLLCAVCSFASCGGGGEGGDNMNEYWVSAARFANRTKMIRLTNAMGNVVIESKESINIGPDEESEVEPEATDTGIITAQMMTYNMPNTTTFLASGTRYVTDPENKTATLTIRTLEQPSAGESELEATSFLVQLFGAPGRYVTPLDQKIYYTIQGEVTIHLDFSTGRWTVEGQTNQPHALEGSGTITVLRAY